MERQAFRITTKTLHMKIEVSQEWFVQVLLEKLKKIDKKLTKADQMTFAQKKLSEDEIFTLWENIRSASLQIDKLIYALE